MAMLPEHYVKTVTQLDEMINLHESDLIEAEQQLVVLDEMIERGYMKPFADVRAHLCVDICLPGG